jgi:hypothetical protein
MAKKKAKHPWPKGGGKPRYTPVTAEGERAERVARLKARLHDPRFVGNPAIPSLERILFGMRLTPDQAAAVQNMLRSVDVGAMDPDAALQVMASTFGAREVAYEGSHQDGAFEKLGFAWLDFEKPQKLTSVYEGHEGYEKPTLIYDYYSGDWVIDSPAEYADARYARFGMSDDPDDEFRRNPGKRTPPKSVVLGDGHRAKVGDWVWFKSDQEQVGKIIKIEQRPYQRFLGSGTPRLTLESEDPSGFEGDYIRGERTYIEEADRCSWAEHWNRNPDPDVDPFAATPVMYHAGPSIERDIVFAVVRNGPATAADIWNLVRDRFPAATPAAVLEICGYLVDQGAFEQLGGDVFTSRRA